MDELRAMADNDLEFFQYMRVHPYYIRQVYRDDTAFNEIIEHYKVDTHKTFGDRVEKIGQFASMAQMFL